MTETPNDDEPGFLAEDPEHLHDGCRLIQLGKSYHPTVENEVLVRLLSLLQQHSPGDSAPAGLYCLLDSSRPRYRSKTRARHTKRRTNVQMTAMPTITT